MNIFKKILNVYPKKEAEKQHGKAVDNNTSEDAAVKKIGVGVIVGFVALLICILALSGKGIHTVPSSETDKLPSKKTEKTIEDKNPATNSMSAEASDDISNITPVTVIEPQDETDALSEFDYGINTDAELLIPNKDIEAPSEEYVGDRGYDDDIILDTESLWTDKNKYYTTVRDKALVVASQYMVSPVVLITLAMENSAWGQLDTAVKYNNPYRIQSENTGIPLSLVYQDMMGMTVVEEAVYKTYVSVDECIRDMAEILVSLNITDETPLYDAFSMLEAKTTLVYPYYVDHLVAEAERISEQLAGNDIPHYFDAWGYERLGSA